MGLRVLDLFAGAGGFTLAGEMAGGYETVAFCEIDPYAQRVLRARWPDVPIHADVTKLKGADVGAVDVITGGFPCFTAGTLVNTTQGLVEIESIMVGDRALTHNGRYMPVVQVMRRDGAETFDMKVMGAPTIRTTEEHPFYVLKDGVATWVKLRDVVRGNLIALPTSTERKSNKDFDPYLLGRWLGDGWVVRHKRSGRKNSYASRVHWCCARDEEDALQREFDRAGYSVTKDKAATVTKYVRQDAALASLLEDFGNKAHGKKIPNWVYAKPVDWRVAFLKGYEDSDGHKRGNGTCYTTVSRALAVGVSRLIRETFGRVARVHECTTARDCIIEGRKVSEQKFYQVIDGKVENKQAVYEQGRWWVPVRSIKPTGLLETVYNFGVKDDESYVADGIVCHNCQDLSATGRQAGIGEGTRSGLFREMLRLAGECGKPYIIFENVSRLLSGPAHDPGQWFGEFLYALAECGYDAEWFNLAASAVGGPHERKRVCVVAYPHEAPVERGGISRRVHQEHADLDRVSCWWQDGSGPERRVCGVDDGVSMRAHRIRSGIMGNAIVPPLFAIVMRALRETIEDCEGK